MCSSFAKEPDKATAKVGALLRQLDKLLLASDQDTNELVDIYLKIFESSPHEDVGKLAALNAYAYLLALNRLDAASGLLAEIAKVYGPDETCPNLLNPAFPLRLVASAKVERARLFAKSGLYQAGLEEIAFVRRGRKAGTEGFCGMPIGEFVYFGPTEVVLDLFEAELMSKIEPASGLSQFSSILSEHKGLPLAWFVRQGVKYPLDFAVVEMVFEVVGSEVFSFERASQILQDISKKCWTDECRAQALFLRAELWELKTEARTQAKALEVEEILTNLIKGYEGVLIKKWSSNKMTITKPACVAAIKLAELYKKTDRHAMGSKRLAELLDVVKSNDTKGHITVAIAKLLEDVEGPSSSNVQSYYTKCLTEYALEPYYPYKEDKPRYIIDAVPDGVKREIIGERSR